MNFVLVKESHVTPTERFNRSFHFCSIFLLPFLTLFFFFNLFSFFRSFFLFDHCSVRKERSKTKVTMSSVDNPFRLFSSSKRERLLAEKRFLREKKLCVLRVETTAMNERFLVLLSIPSSKLSSFFPIFLLLFLFFCFSFFIISFLSPFSFFFFLASFNTVKITMIFFFAKKKEEEIEKIETKRKKK